MMPIYGSAYIGVVPATDGKIIGLSKYDRIVDYFASRLQIQEELVKQIRNSSSIPRSRAGSRCASVPCICARRIVA